METRPVLEVTAVVPILRIFSIEKAQEFYLGYLGFKVDWEHRFEPTLPLYMQVSLGNCVLHLSEHHGDACPGSTVFLRVRNLQAYHAQLAAKNYPYLRPGMETKPWGSIGFDAIDPFGNRLRFDENQSAVAP